MPTREPKPRCHQWRPVGPEAPTDEICAACKARCRRGADGSIVLYTGANYASVPWSAEMPR